MTRLHVIRSDSYIEDLLTVWEYLRHWSIALADRIVNEIETKVDTLEQFPDLGERCPEHFDNCRRTLCGKWIIYYRRYDDRLVIIGVIHSAQEETSLSKE